MPPSARLISGLLLCVAWCACSTSVSVDDFASVQAALDFAQQHSDVYRVLFSPGTEYRLGAPESAPDTHTLHLQGASDLAIDGQGARLVVTDPGLGLLYLSHCTNVTVQRLEVTYDPLPNAQGTIVAVDRPSASIAVELAPNDTLAPPIFADASYRWALIKDRSYPRRQKPGLPNTLNVQAFRRVGRGKAGSALWNVTLPKYIFAPMRTAPTPIEVGDPYVQLARTNAASVFAPYSCRDVTFGPDIRILAAPAASYVALNCTALRFARVVTAPAPGRWQATGADGIFTVGTRSAAPARGAPAVVVEDTVLECVGDDALILKTEPVQLAAAPRGVPGVLSGGSAQTLLSLALNGTSWLMQVRAGDLLRFFDPRPDAPGGGTPASRHDLGNATAVADAVPYGASPATANVTVDFGSGAAGAAAAAALLAGRRWASALVYNDATAAPFFRVRNLSVACARRWGALLEAHDGELADSAFSNTSSQAIMLANGGTSGLGGRLDGGFVTRNMSIVRNRFEHCYVQGPSVSANCKGGAAGCAAVAGSVVVGTDGGSSSKAALLSWRGHDGLRFENNTVDGWQRGVAALSIAGARHVLVRGNVLRALAGEGQGAAEEAPWGAAIRVTNVTGVKIEGNAMCGPFAPNVTAGAVQIGAGADDVVVSPNNSVTPEPEPRG